MPPARSPSATSVSPHHRAGGVRPDQIGHAAAGAGDGDRLCPLAERTAVLPSRTAEDLFAGWWRLIQGLGAVPRVLVWDGEGAVGQRRRRVTILTQQAHAFRGVLGAKILICDPGDPEAKGLVERANGYLETSFLPGRSFTSPADFNAQLDDWLVLAEPPAASCTGLRTSRSHRRRPGGDAPATAGRAGHRLARLVAAAPRPLHSPGQQRLLGAPGRGRPPRRGRRRPEPCSAPSATASSWLTTSAAGLATRPSATSPTCRLPPGCATTAPPDLA